MTDLQAAFIQLDTYIQQVDDKQLAQNLIYGMIDIMNALAKTELQEYFNDYPQEKDHQKEV